MLVARQPLLASRSRVHTLLIPVHHRSFATRTFDDFAHLRDSYETPKYPIVLAHGVLGFSELSLFPFLPPIRYWHGIKEALEANESTVLIASVPPSGSIHERGRKLAADVAGSGTVNIIAHSMGGLDARYMISRLRPRDRVRVASLVTIATPHRGSPFADYLVQEGSGSPIHLPKLYKTMSKVGLGTEAFAQLTTEYMTQEFNPQVADDPSVHYFSYGAAMIKRPSLFDPFRLPHRIVERAEGINDGLVSVESSRWGTYRGTLMGVSHLDLINWTNRVQWAVRGWIGEKPTFNAVAFYLSIADSLAKAGL